MSIVFAAKHSFAEKKGCKVKKQKFSKIGGLFANMQFLCFSAVLFLSHCFCFFFGGKSPKGYFPAVLDSSPFFFPRKACPLKSFSSSYSVFYPGCPVVFPFKIPFFFALWCLKPFSDFFFFFGGGGGSSVFFLPFPLLMFACFC